MTTFTYDELVMQLREQGVPLKQAQAAACRELNAHGRIGITVDAPDAGALEDVHVDAGDKLVRALGGHVVRNSQKRASKVTPGVPDRRYYFPAHRVAFWWEAKREGGKQSSAQVLFQELCDACHDHYFAGPLRELETVLITFQIGRKEPDGTWTPLPFHPLIEDRP